MEVAELGSAPTTESPIVESTPVDTTPEPSPSSEPDIELDTDAFLEKTAQEYDKSVKAPAPEAKPAVDEPNPVEAEKSKAETPEPEQPSFAEPEPEAIKKAFKSLQKWHPDVAKQIRDDHYAAKAFRELMPITEAREFRQLFASPQEAKEARSAHADLLAMNEGLHTDPGGLLNHIAQNDPQGFANLATNLPKFFYEKNPELYAEAVSRPAVTNFHSVVANAFPADEDLKTAIEIIYDRAGKLTGKPSQMPTVGQQPAAQRDPQVEKELRELRQFKEQRQSSEQQYQMEVRKGFHDAMRRDFNDQVTKEVEALIARTGGDFVDEDRQEIADAVLNEVKDRLRADGVLQRKIDFSINARGSNLDDALRARLVGELTANAKRFVPGLLAERVTRLTNRYAKLSKEKTAQAASAVPRKDPGGSVSLSGSSKPKLTQAQLDKLSTDDLIDYYAKPRG